MLSVHSEQLHKTGFPTVHALVLLEGTMNLTGETQPLVEQLMMVKRMQVGGHGGISGPKVGRLGKAAGRPLVFLGGSGVSPRPARISQVQWFCNVTCHPCLSHTSGGGARAAWPLTHLSPRGQETEGADALMPRLRVFPQHIPTPLFVLEIWKACFVGLIESPEGTGELKWTAFTFLKVPGMWGPQRARLGRVLREVTPGVAQGGRGSPPSLTAFP